MKHFLIFIFATVLVLKSCESNSVTTETPFYDIQIFRNNECSNGFRYRIPLDGDGECQQIPPWIYEDEWRLRISVPKHLYVRFFEDKNCSETMEVEMSKTSSISTGTLGASSIQPSNCLSAELERFGIKVKSLRLIENRLN